MSQAITEEPMHSSPSVAVPRRQSYSATAAGGSAWAIAQSLFGKAVSLGGAVVISWLVSPADVGLAALAFAVMAFPAFLSPPLVSDILVQRPEEAAALRSPARRLAWGSAILTAIIALALTPWISSVYGAPALLYLMPLASLRGLFTAAGVDSLATLRLRFRFRDIAQTGNFGVVAANVLAIAFAWTGLGAIAIVVGQSLGQLVTGIGYRLRAGRASGGEPRRWRELVRPYLVLCTGHWVQNFATVASTLCLGAIFSPAKVGLFAFAQNLSTQTNALLAQNVGVVLQPIFSHLRDDPERQVAGFTRACAIMAAVAAPISLAQAAVSYPLLSTVFSREWMPAVDALTLLATAQYFGSTLGPTIGLLKAQGRFTALAWWQFGRTASLVVLLLVAASTYDLLGAALAVLAHSAITAPIGLWLAMRGTKGTASRIARVYLGPFLAAAPVFGLAWCVAEYLLPDANAPVIGVLRAIPETAHLVAILLKGVNLGALLALPIVGSVIYVALYRRIDPTTFHDAVRVLAGLVKRLRGARGGA